MKLGYLIGGIVLLFAMEIGTVFAQTNKSVIKDAEALHELACSNTEGSDAPWHISNLYDCRKKAMFIPYHLWTGMAWDGDKDAPCMHEASTIFFVNGVSKTTISGPQEWRGKKIWIRAKSSGRKTQYFECHNRGIGRVYEIRGGKSRVYKRTGRCKFPAGYGWKLGKRRRCANTAIEIDKIEFGENRELFALEFKWWYRGRAGYRLDHRYRYQPNVGSTNAWPQQ